MHLEKIVLFCCADELLQQVIAQRIEQENISVLIAKDGDEATTIIENKEVDLVLTEELLPFKSGFELIKLCASKHLPSIIISDTKLEQKVVDAFDLGAVDFIDKPYSPNELVARIKNVFRHYSA